MKVPTNELLLALRSPRSGWLATMICALEEAMRDADFSEHHRGLVAQLLDGGAIPAPVAAAAEERLGQFEHSVAETQHGLAAALFEPAATAAMSPRPKLTLVGNAA
jgi:hypothetical protein